MAQQKDTQPDSSSQTASSSPPEEASGGTTFARGVKLAGEAFVVPGSSLILDGRVGAGAAHLVGGLVAGALLGPVGYFLVAANSYTKSVTDHHLHEHFQSAQKA